MVLYDSYVDTANVNGFIQPYCLTDRTYVTVELLPIGMVVFRLSVCPSVCPSVRNGCIVAKLQFVRKKLFTLIIRHVC